MKTFRRSFHALIAPLGLGLLLLAGWGCQDPIPSDPIDIPGTLWMEVDLHWNGEPYALNENAEDHIGHTLTISNLKMYISEVELQDMDGVWHRNARTESVHLLDFHAPQPHLLEAFPEGTYQAIRFGVGIPEEINRGTDPALFPNDHPMGFLGSAGMFWTWSTGYIFMKYEGRAAPLGSEVMNSPIAYHCGTDASYRTVSLEFPYAIYIGAQERVEMPLVFDAARVLVGPEDSIDVIAEPLTHNGPNDPLGSRLMDLLTQAWSAQ